MVCGTMGCEFRQVLQTGKIILHKCYVKKQILFLHYGLETQVEKIKKIDYDILV
jgi:hypothetical protein